jgi:hypothetical protein
MNCFEARQEFVTFWRRTMPQDRRAEFSAHLGECPRCDRSFRIFALSAPVLHSDTEPEPGASPARMIGLHSVAAPVFGSDRTARTRFVARPWRAMGAAFAMTAAAGLALFVAVGSPRDSFEDAIAGEDPNVELTAYTPAGNLLGQDIPPEANNPREPLLQESPANLQNDFAG